MRLFYRAKHAKKRKLRLPLSAYLSYLLITTVLLTGVSTSKFASTHSISDNARIAVVELAGDKVDGQSTALDVGESIVDPNALVTSYSFYVTNQSSEVALEYSIVVTLPKALPAGLTMTMTPDGEAAEEAASVQNNTYLFSGSTFQAGVTEQHTYTLTFTVTGDIAQEDTLTDIKIAATAEQIN